MNKFCVERAAESDAEQIGSLEKACLRLPWSVSQIAEAIGSGRYAFFVVRGTDGMVAAYGGVCFASDEAEICNIVTAENYRGFGAANLILDEIMAECGRRGADKIFLEVAENNEPAKNLYRKKGFVKISVRKNYYGEGENAEIMECVKNGDFRTRN